MLTGPRIHICRACLRHFYSEKSLASHMELCCKQNPVKARMPIENVTDFIEFNSSKFRMQQFVPYVIYADFESALLHLPDTIDLDANSIKTHIHSPTSFAYYIVSRNPEDKHEYVPILYRGPNAD